MVSAGSTTPATPATSPTPQILQDKVIVLSGVGPGLGRAFGEEAAKMGADLVIASDGTVDSTTRIVAHLEHKAVTRDGP